jgi:hypothetical protein
MPKEINFETSLKTFVRSTKASMAAALACATLSLAHFAEHGDTSQLNRFVEAMPKNYIRRAAFVKWALAHAPLKLEGGKFVKDKAENAVPLNLEAANAKPFWDFAPDQEDMIFSDADVYAAFTNAIKKFRKDKSKPKDEGSRAFLDKAAAWIEQNKPVAKAA